MKVKISKEEIEKLKDDPNTKVKADDPWWLVVIKVLTYLSGLFLAGYATVSCTTMLL